MRETIERVADISFAAPVSARWILPGRVFFGAGAAAAGGSAGAWRLVGPIGINELLAVQSVFQIADSVLRVENRVGVVAGYRAFVLVLVDQHFNERVHPIVGVLDVGRVEGVAEINGRLLLVRKAVRSARLWSLVLRRCWFWLSAAGASFPPPLSPAPTAA